MYRRYFGMIIFVFLFLFLFFFSAVRVFPRFCGKVVYVSSFNKMVLHIILCMCGPQASSCCFVYIKLNY
ncbi:hypothetical protein DFH27DRAFT_189827 [Peziza echinospora]|nr:hypothetical protein DFH27DRAFT_189827 [Peziza echinospora]